MRKLLTALTLGLAAWPSVATLHEGARAPNFVTTGALGGKPFKLDSSTPSIPIADFVATETRFAVLKRTHPKRAAELATLAQADADERWHYYEQLAGIERTVPHVHRPDPSIVPEVESDAGYRYEGEGEGS